MKFNQNDKSSKATESIVCIEVTKGKILHYYSYYSEIPSKYFFYLINIICGISNNLEQNEFVRMIQAVL